ncbi:MAG: lysozyme [Methylocystis sp.]|uniref:lysozyme n=1 Tax=Methylocystis sp. TaxID=1911079 RepID=UPI003DA66550
MSAAGRALLIQREGFKTRAYRDSVGVLTIGVGHTSAAGAPAVSPGMTISKSEVDAILSRDLSQFENAVEGAVNAPLTQGQFDALVSLCFNIGIGAFQKSTVARRLNEGNYRGAADAFLMWNKPPEIIRRRRGERDQFLKATATGTAGAPVRFVAEHELAEDEGVNLDYLRASGSRTVTMADKIKGWAASLGLSDIMGMASQGKEYASRAHDLAQGFESGAPTGELLETYAPFLIGAGVGVLVVVVAALVWWAAHRIQSARLEDAVYQAAA